MNNSLAIYLREIGQFQLLTKEQELELGRRIKDEGDEDAREQLINCNLRLVVSVAKNFANGNHNIALEDLIADGNTGLMTAVEKYDYTLGYRFSTCAVPWIKQAITKSIIDKSRMIRIPAHIIQQFNAYKTAVEELMSELEHEPTNEEIAARMGITEENLRELLSWKQNTSSLDMPLGEDEDGTLEDVCADTQTETPVEYTERRLKQDFVSKLLEGVDERTRTIFKLRFGFAEEGDPEYFGYEHTLEEIGDMLNPKITRERVRQIITKQISTWKLQYGDKLNF